jgi:hypothetical protein
LIAHRDLLKAVLIISHSDTVISMARIAHHVFFTLKDRSDEAAQTLLAACQKYLDQHDGVVDFSVGTRDKELDREVNRDFDVSLHVIFQDRAAHDVYQTHERHLQFIAEQKDNWQVVEVCDSILV